LYLTGPTAADLIILNNLDVTFSGPRREADGIIEDRISDSSAPRRLTVVSSDNRVIRAAGHRKAKAVKSDDFWRVIVRHYKRKRLTAEPAPEILRFERGRNPAVA